jgi:CMP-N,N'-diacetyllegionaminic acid synthase
VSCKIALIPARAGSERFPNKNIADFYGHPLIAYSIKSALTGKKFQKVVVSTDSPEIARIALSYGAIVPMLRPKQIATTQSPDFEWVQLAINDWLELEDSDQITILRPTNPMRSVSTIVDALNVFDSKPDFDSLRAIREVKEHPAKMWRGLPNQQIYPLDDSINPITGAPGHSSPFQTLERLWIQDASLEIARVSSVRKHKTISGNKIIGYKLPLYEGFDINYPDDIHALESIISKNPSLLPKFFL